MTIRIDRARALELLAEVVAEKGPDYVYEKVGGRCAYQVNGEPSCGVGHVLVKAGVKGPDLAAVEGTSLSGLVDAHGRILTLGVELDPAAREPLDTFQLHQDQGVKYGNCLQLAAEASE